MVKRRKFRKSKDSPSEKRVKDRDGEVAIARGRLAGALKGLLNRCPDDMDETDSTCFQSPNMAFKKVLNDSSTSPWRRPSYKGNETEDHQSYFMKLLDRSVDLAQFDINTPLYPICRAWIQNKPFSFRKSNTESGLVEIKHESENDEQLFELNERPDFIKPEDSDLFRLPPPQPLPENVHTLRIPAPLPREIEDINLNADPESLPTREELLKSHLENWTTVRKRWRVASRLNEERYAASKEILTRMYDRAQTQFRGGS